MELINNQFIKDLEIKDLSFIPLYYFISPDNQIPFREMSSTVESNESKKDETISSINNSQEFQIDKNKSKYFRIYKEKHKHNIIRSGKKRKRPPQEGEKIHDKTTPDNILRKIQVHYLSFIRSYINEILGELGFNVKFVDINYNEKRIINKKKVSLLKTLNIGEILCQEISKKYRKQFKENEKKNHIIFEEVNKNKIISDILSQNYLRLFNDVYYINNKYIDRNGLHFKLSEKVATFEDLLKKNKANNINDSYRRKIEDVVKKNYFFTKKFTIK